MIFCIFRNIVTGRQSLCNIRRFYSAAVQRQVLIGGYFSTDNVGLLEVLMLLRIFANCLAKTCLNRVLVVSGPRSGRSHSVVHYSGTKCHEVIDTLYNPDNPVTLRTGVHKGTLREP